MNDLSYLTGHYDAKIKKINDFGAPLNFIFFTDPHNRLNEDWCRKAGLKYELAANAAYSMQSVQLAAYSRATAKAARQYAHGPKMSKSPRYPSPTPRKS